MADQLEPSLADFLRAARGRLSPDAAGIAEVGRRRVNGLRREELAMLAGVSVDYYTRLEQGGRSKSASLEVLDALADALQLDDSERNHLHTIARREPTRRRRADKPQRLHASTLELLETFDAALQPAFVLGRRLDVLGHNRLAGLLVADFENRPAAERNQARFVFLDPPTRATCTSTGTASPRTPLPCCAWMRASIPTIRGSALWWVNCPSTARNSSSCGRATACMSGASAPSGTTIRWWVI